MIRLIRGTVVASGKNYLVVDTGGADGGFGMRVFVPEPTLIRYRNQAPIRLHTYLQVRESELSLYGFESEEELGLFEMLLGVNGVGPRVALAVLSTLTPDTLHLAIGNQEPAVIARVPGVGKRTSEKIVLELKDKLQPGKAELAVLARSLDADTEVVEALTALGYSVVEAQRAVQKIPTSVTGVEERLRVALSQFGG
jgi:holliday junction DNA helicase RuvA